MKEMCGNWGYTWDKFRTRENWYKFSAKDHKDLKSFFKSFPVFSFKTDSNATIKWFPSEYFYRTGTTEYWLAIDPFGGGSQMIIGGSMMRQNMYIFDIEKNKVGTVRAKWSQDPNMFVYDDPKYEDPNVRIKENDPVEEPTPSQEPEPTNSSQPNPKPVDIDRNQIKIIRL